MSGMYKSSYCIERNFAVQHLIENVDHTQQSTFNRYRSIRTVITAQKNTNERLYHKGGDLFLKGITERLKGAESMYVLNGGASEKDGFTRISYARFYATS